MKHNKTGPPPGWKVQENPLFTRLLADAHRLQGRNEKYICCICMTEDTRDTELDDEENRDSVHSTTEYLFSDGFDWEGLSKELEQIVKDCSACGPTFPNVSRFSEILKGKV